MNRLMPPWMMYLLAGVLLALDQATKIWVRANVPLGGVYVPIPAIADYFDILHTLNTGAAFGMFQGGNVIFAVVAVIVTIAIVLYNRELEYDQGWLRFALGLQMAGALGNLIDRLHQPGVTDWAHFHWRNIYDAPIFNIADLSIVTGVIVLIALVAFDSLSEARADERAEDVRDAVSPPAASARVAARSAAPVYTEVDPAVPPARLVGRVATQEATMNTTPTTPGDEANSPIQTVIYWGGIGAAAGAVVGSLLRQRMLGLLGGLVAGVLIAVFRLPDERD